VVTRVETGTELPINPAKPKFCLVTVSDQFVLVYVLKIKVGRGFLHGQAYDLRDPPSVIAVGLLPY
jgi:hypothetical protein